eukprot:IDg4575t1
MPVMAATLRFTTADAPSRLIALSSTIFTACSSPVSRFLARRTMRRGLSSRRARAAPPIAVHTRMRARYSPQMPTTLACSRS